MRSPQAKQEIANKDVGAQTTGKDGQSTDLKVSGDGSIGDAPKVNFDDDGGANNAGSNKPQKLSPDAVADGTGIIDQFTDLGAKGLAAQYPNLGTAISEKEAVAQKSMEENILA